MRLLLAIWLGTLGIEFGHHPIDIALVIRDTLKFKTAAQIKLLGQAIFKMSMGRLNGPILVGNAEIVAGGLQTIVLAEVLIELGQLFMVTTRMR